MNLLRLVYEWPPPWSGLTPGPFEMTFAQAVQGHHIQVLCGGRTDRAKTIISGVQVRRLLPALPKLSLFATTAPAALLALQRHHRWADLIHGHQHLPVFYHMWRRRLGDRKPYVFHLHITAAGRAEQAAAAGQSLDWWTRRFEWPLHIRSDQLGVQVADRIVCVSDSVREEAIRHYAADPAKIRVVSNGVNTRRFSPAGEELRPRFGYTPQDRLILFVGVLAARKRPLLLLEALVHLPPNWKLLMIGSGPLQPTLEARARELGLEDRVTITGYVPYPDLPAYYRTVDVFALPAEYEGFPKVVLEALACGVPVVSTASFALDPVLEPFVVFPKVAAPASLADSLREAEQIKVDTHLLRSSYDWSVKAAQLQAIYDEIV